MVSDLESESEALLGNHEDAEMTPWVGRVLDASKFIRRLPAQLLLTAAYVAVMVYSSYAATRAAIAAGLASADGCSTRACLFWVVTCIVQIADWCSMLFMMRGEALEEHLPSPWDQNKLSRQCVNKCMKMWPGEGLAALIFGMVPALIWLRNGMSEFIGAALLDIPIALLHNWLNALTFNFYAVYAKAWQHEFTNSVTSGELTYAAAVVSYSRVNSCRKALSSVLERCLPTTMGLFLLVQAILLYDFEFKPWSGWIFGVWFVFNVLVMLMGFEPWIGLNDWPEELSSLVMESRALEWSPSERTNFCMHVAATRVRIRFFEFEMGPSFRTALPVFFLGWWLYVTELHQFHDFRGFPFDQSCGANTTDVL